MRSDFFTTLFPNIDQLFESPTILLNIANLDLVKIFTYFVAEQESQNFILLPEEYISPAFGIKEIQLKEKIKFNEFLQLLGSYGYERVEQVFEQMQYSVKGDVVSVFTNITNLVYRIEFFGEEIEAISLLDAASLRVLRKVENAVFTTIFKEEVTFLPEFYGEFSTFSKKVVLHNPQNLLHEEEKYKFRGVPLFHQNGKVFQQILAKYEAEYTFFYVGKYWENLSEDFKQIGTKPINNTTLPFPLESGFIEENTKTILLTDKEILSTLNLNKSKKNSSKFKKFFDTEVNVDDFIVHEAHGVGKYKGIETKVVLGEVNDYVIIEYLDNDKLLIPLSQLGRISKFVAIEGHEPRLTKLGTVEWENIKRKLKKSVEDIAQELLAIYAKKSVEKGIKFDPDTTEQEKFEQEFKYNLTEDQARTISEVKNDMESLKPMDRLVIGDVGFGKTEIALRAGFKALQSGKQILVLAPTTVLASQLYNVFSLRFGSFGAKIARVSRFDGTRKNAENIALANEGKIDVLIGTHRLLSTDINLPNLGLLIVDEEQRFGVKQKEKIRKLRANIDLLSMSATPIPRTLQMALTGIKDISIIATPPKGRLPVHNEVIFKNEIADKINFEYKRKGQVFIVHNRIESMDQFVEEIRQELSPQIKIEYAHGQMKAEKLEELMYRFQEKEFDVLIATTIIENGIDIASVNTIIIDDAHTFGLSQLYQLRGRVGRSSTQSFCYLVVPKVKAFLKLHKKRSKQDESLHKILEENEVEANWITVEAVARIEAILENQELGAGFKIASRDLEIRGSGNILGSQQSGHINAVGYEMYIRLLEEEIKKIRTQEKELKKQQENLKYQGVPSAT